MPKLNKLQGQENQEHEQSWCFIIIQCPVHLHVLKYTRRLYKVTQVSCSRSQLPTFSWQKRGKIQEGKSYILFLLLIASIKLLCLEHGSRASAFHKSGACLASVIGHESQSDYNLSGLRCKTRVLLALEASDILDLLYPRLWGGKNHITVHFYLSFSFCLRFRDSTKGFVPPFWQIVKASEIYPGSTSTLCNDNSFPITTYWKEPDVLILTLL